MARQRGEIYFVNLDPAVGREQSGNPPVVLSANAVNNLPLVVTVVVGTKGSNLTRDYKFNARDPSSDSGLPLETVFVCFQLRSLDASRFPATPAGNLSLPAMRNVESTVRLCMKL